MALLFGARDWLREHLDATLANPGALVFSCCIIGVAESIIYCPLDLLKARMQVCACTVSLRKLGFRLQAIPFESQGTTFKETRAWGKMGMAEKGKWGERGGGYAFAVH